MGNNICGIKLRKTKEEQPEEDEVYMSFREVINSPKRMEVIDLTMKKQTPMRPTSTSTCSIRQSSTSGVSSDENDIYDVLPLDQSSDYDVPVSSSRLPAVPVNIEDDYDVPRANCNSRVWLTDNEDEEEYDIPRQHQNFDDTYDVPRSFHPK